MIIINFIFEIYWLTRVDTLNTLFGWMIAIPVVVGIVMFIAFLISMENIRSEEVDENWLSFKKHCKKFRNVLLPVFIVGILGTGFCPTKNDMLLIYGVGGSIDYLRNNPTAQKLPDKCIEALDAWVDELFPEKKDSIK